VSSLQKSIASGISLVALLSVGATLLSAQAPDERHCFSIHVRLNGKMIEDPLLITLKSTDAEVTVSREGKCFTMPPALLKQEKLAVSFTLPRDKVDLPAEAIGFFAGPWDVELEDKKFDKYVPVPKHARARETCVVVFHVGEPETALTATPCRSPLPAKRQR
jgi:hypothetical protein